MLLHYEDNLRRSKMLLANEFVRGVINKKGALAISQLTIIHFIILNKNALFSFIRNVRWFPLIQFFSLRWHPRAIRYVLSNFLRYVDVVK